MVVTSSPALFTMALQRTARWWCYCIWNCLHPCHNPPNYKDSPQLYMTAMVATNSLTCVITGVIVGGIELPFNGCPKNACEHISEGVMNHQHLVCSCDWLVALIFQLALSLQGDCPTEEGEVLVYDINIPIENFFPTIEILGRLST